VSVYTRIYIRIPIYIIYIIVNDVFHSKIKKLYNNHHLYIYIYSKNYDDLIEVNYYFVFN